MSNLINNVKPGSLIKVSSTFIVTQYDDSFMNNQISDYDKATVKLVILESNTIFTFVSNYGKNFPNLASNRSIVQIFFNNSSFTISISDEEFLEHCKILSS